MSLAFGQMRQALSVVVLAAMCAGAGVGVARAGGSANAPRIARLTTSPALFPAFSPAVTDYAVRCGGRATTRVATVAAAGTVATIDGVRERTASLPLRPGQAVTVLGTRGGKTAAYHVRCLPTDFPAWQAAGNGTAGQFFVTAPSLSLGSAQGHYVVIFDSHGVPVWWYRDAGQPIDAKILPGGDVAFADFNGAMPAYQVRALDGTLAGRVVSPDGEIDDHELQTATGGNTYSLVYQPQQNVDLAALGGPADATVYNGEIEELSPSGKLLWSWSTAGHVALDELTDWKTTIADAPVMVAGSPIYDIVHANSVSVLGNVVLLSLRYADAVYAIDRASGAILWKLGGTLTPNSISVVGDPLAAQPFVGQHDARLLADGTVTVFDDGSFVRAPRAVHYRIDAGARTATFLSSVFDPTVTASPCCGSARLLDNGDWLVSWGGDSVVGEYARDGTPKLRIDFDGLFSYRAVPVDSPRVTAASLRAGMDAMAKR